MKSRELAATLKLLRAFGVTNYSDGTISLTFGDSSPPQTAMEMQEVEPEAAHEGGFDPVAMLARINRKHGKGAQ